MNLLLERLPQLLTLVEEYRPVKDYEDLYEVSNTGKVRSFDRIDSRGCRRKGQVLGLFKTPKGYFRAALCRDGKMTKRPVHRLVAEAFQGEIAEGLVVRHLTDDPDLNILPMLEIGTQKDNIADQVQNGRHNLVNLHGSKTHCPRGHQLDGINLKPSELKRGRRACVSCHRASNHNYNRKLGLAVDSPEFQALSDEFYRATLAGFTSPEKFYSAVAATVTS